MIKLVILKILLLILVLTGLNFIYKHTLYPAHLQEKSKELIKLKENQEITDVFYFGESSNVTYREQDTMKNSISEFASMYYPSLRFTNINKNATHAGIYKSWLKTIDRKKKLPKAIIVTLNLRSFNAAWINSDLETQLQEAIVFTRPYPALANRFMLSLQAFDNKTPEQREALMLEQWKTVPLIFPYPFKHQTVSEWDAAMAAGGYVKTDGSWDMDKIVLACHYIKGYAFNIKADNPRVKDFDQIFKWCGKNKIQLYLNLMAENTQYADSLVGKDLVFLMRQNRDFLIRRYHKDHCKVIDNLESVTGKDFIDQNWTSEHYVERGRKRVAKNVADTLRNQFKNEYKQAY